LLGRFTGDNPFSFAHHIEPVGGEIRQRFFLPIGPQNLGAIETLMAAQPEVQAQIVL
jgi:hypothetical protein